MSDSVERLLVRIDATTEQLRRELKLADTSVGSFQRTVQKKLREVNRSVDSFRKSITGKFAGLFTVAGIGLFTREVIQASDSMAKYRGQLGLVTNSTEELNATYAKTLKLANETGQSTEATVNLYARLARATETLGLSQEEVLGLTKSINQSFVISGASAEEAASAALQLSQAFAKGTLDGDELKSVMESNPRLAKAIAEGMGIAVGALKEYGKEGKLSAAAVAEALAKNADTINAEFQDMPMTIGRIWQTLANDINDALGQVDASPLIDSVEELRALIADPNFRKNIISLSQAMITFASSTAAAMAAVVEKTRAAAEAVAQAVTGFTMDDTDGIENRLSGLKEYLASIEAMGQKTGPTVNAIKEEIAGLERQLRLAESAANGFVDGVKRLQPVLVLSSRWVGKLTKDVEVYGKSEKELAKQIKAVEKAQKSALSQHKKNTKSLEDSYEALDDMVRAGDRFIEQQEFEIKLLGMTAREQAIANAERAAGTRITEAHAEAIRKNAAAMYDIETAAEQASKATEQMEQAWASSRSTLSDFFFEFARDGKNAFDTLLDGFKAMLAKMIAEAAANQIILGIGTVAGGLGFSGAASAASAAGSSGGGVGGLISLGGSAYSAYSAGGASGVITGGLQGTAGYFESIGFDAGAQWATGVEGSLASAGGGNVALGSLYSAGAGIAGGYVGSKVYGDTTGIGQTAGTVVGSYWGPWGAAVGSFIGGGIEKVLGNVFGFGGVGGNDAGRADVNLATGQIEAYGVGKKFDQSNVDAAAQIAESLKLFSDAIGGSNAEINLKVGNRSGLAFNDKHYADQEEFLAAAFGVIIDGATGLSKTLKALIKGFDGTSDELFAFTSSLFSITELIKDNPVDIAIRDFALASERAGRTLTDTYNGQIGVINDLIYGFDGSAEGAVTLNNALSVNKQLAYDMAMALQAIGDSTKSVVSGQVDYFNEAVRTPDESLAYMEKQLTFLDALLPKLTDPNQILATRDKALELNKSIFDAGPEDLQRSNVQTYIDMANTIGEQTAIALENATSGLQSSQQDLNQQIGGMLEVAAAGFQAPADTMYSAAQLMYLAVQNFINNGGTYNEVVA